MTKENGEAKINGGGRIRVEREDIEDKCRDGMMGVFAKSNGRFESIDRLARPATIFVKAGLDVASFLKRGFPKN